MFRVEHRIDTRPACTSALSYTCRKILILVTAIDTSRSWFPNLP
jgi:hypothetical protein